MKYQAGDYVAVHHEPIWRDRSNSVFHAHIGTEDGVNQWEQLWGRKTGVTRFVLCCIPFFVYDLNLGDEVETDANFVLQKVTLRSGQITFRVWFDSQDMTTRQELMRDIESMKPFMEWSSENLLALSAHDELDAQKLADYLQVREVQGLLQYEAGQVAERQ